MHSICVGASQQAKLKLTGKLRLFKSFHSLHHHLFPRALGFSFRKSANNMDIWSVHALHEEALMKKDTIPAQGSRDAPSCAPW